MFGENTARSRVSGRDYCVVVATLNPNMAGGLVELAAALAGARLEGEDRHIRIVILGIALVPEEESLSQGAALVRAYRTMLRYVPQNNFADEHLEVQTEVRVAREVWEGIADQVQDESCDLLLLHWKGFSRTPGKVFGATIDALLNNPPCDIVLARFNGHLPRVQSVLLPVRGSSYNRLALSLASNLGEQWRAGISVLHSMEQVPEWLNSTPNVGGVSQSDFPSAFDDEDPEVATLSAVQGMLAEISSVARLVRMQGSPVNGILREAQNHDLLILGASDLNEMTTPAENVIVRVAAQTDKPMLVVKTRRPLELLRPSGYVGSARPNLESREPALTELVDRWFAENTFHYREFRTMSSLTILKMRHNLSISMVLPIYGDINLARMADIVRRAWFALMWDCDLVDELIVCAPDARFSPQQIEQFYSMVGANTVPDMRQKVLYFAPIPDRQGDQHAADYGPAESLWFALRRVRGDIVVWADPTQADLEARLIYGMVGPLLTYPEFELATGFYSDGEPEDEETDADFAPRRNPLVEISLRPMLSSIFPALSGIIDPSCTAGAARRGLLEHLPLFTGPAFSAGLLVDTFGRSGLKSIAQVDLGSKPTGKSHVPYPRMTTDLLAILLRRVAERNQGTLPGGFNPALKTIHKHNGVFALHVQPSKPPQRELPPVAFTAGYRRLTFD
jgi:nucleotide-binding universal stress UspA family protein